MISSGNILGSSKNHLTDEDIAQYVDAVINDKVNILPARIQNHINNCLQCKEQAIEVLNIIDFHKKPYIKDIAEKKIEERKKTKYIRYQIVAASVLLIILINLFIFYKYSSKKNLENNLITNVVDTLKSQTDTNNTTLVTQHAITDQNNINIYVKNEKKPSSNNYKKFEIFEIVINNNYRRLEETKEITPLIEQEFKITDTIYFNWNKQYPGPFNFYVYNNLGEIELKESSLDSNFYYLKPLLSKGLYYWKAENIEDVIYIGKFIIK